MTGPEAGCRAVVMAQISRVHRITGAWMACPLSGIGAGRTSKPAARSSAATSSQRLPGLAGT